MDKDDIEDMDKEVKEIKEKMDELPVLRNKLQKLHLSNHTELQVLLPLVNEHIENYNKYIKLVETKIALLEEREERNEKIYRNQQ